MSTKLPKFPDGHPFAQPLPAGVSPFDVASQIVAFRKGFSGPIGMTMLEGDDEDEDDDEDDDENEDLADPDSTVKVGDRVFKVSELQTFMAREKRQGKKAGKTALAKELGFDSVDDLKAALAKVKPDDQPSGGGDDEAARRAAERERQAAERERTAAERERRADLRGALVSAGVTGKDDLADALVLLDRAIDADYDEDDLDAEVEALKRRRPNLFGAEDDEPETPPKNRTSLPPGGRRRKPKEQKVFGAGGLERAQRQGWVKS